MMNYEAADRVKAAIKFGRLDSVPMIRVSYVNFSVAIFYGFFCGNFFQNLVDEYFNQ